MIVPPAGTVFPPAGAWPHTTPAGTDRVPDAALSVTTTVSPAAWAVRTAVSELCPTRFGTLTTPTVGVAPGSPGIAVGDGEAVPTGAVGDGEAVPTGAVGTALGPPAAVLPAGRHVGSGFAALALVGPDEIVSVTVPP